MTAEKIEKMGRRREEDRKMRGDRLEEERRTTGRGQKNTVSIH